VFIGSAAGRRVFANDAAYVASKHGLAGLAGATFLDVRDRGVKVSVVSPGLVAADGGLLSEAGARHPGDLLTPGDVAAAVRFVARPRSSYSLSGARNDQRPMTEKATGVAR